MWPFKKQEVDMVTIPSVSWAKSTAEGIIKDREVKETKVLLERIGRWIKDEASDGKVNLRISAFYLEYNYHTPHWVLRNNVKNALTPYGYKVDFGINLDYYINIQWGEVPVCPNFNFAKPTIKHNPGPRNKAGE